MAYELVLMRDFDVLNGKQVDCVQSVLRAGGHLNGFTIRFTDGSLLKVDALREDGVDLTFLEAGYYDTK